MTYLPLPPTLAFITPALAAAGLALVSIPIAIHLFNRRRFRTVQWAAMDWLMQAMRRNRRRMRFESWLLLATRCLLLALLGVALARPTGCGDDALARLAGRESGLHVFVLDNSASMAYRHERGDASTHLDHARTLVRSYLERLDAGGQQAAVVTAAAPAAGVVGRPTFDLAGVADAVSGVTQTPFEADLTGAFELAVELAETEPQNRRLTLYVLTDSTPGGLDGGTRLAEVAARAADRFDLVWHDLAARDAANTTVAGLAPAQPLVRSGFDAFFAGDVRGFGRVSDTLVSWSIDGQAVGGTQAVTPDPQGTPVVAGDGEIDRLLRDGRFRVVSAQVTGGDALPGDDRRWLVVEQARQLPVLLVDGGRDAGGFGADLLAVALDPTGGRGETNYLRVETISDLELPGRRLDDYRAVVLSGVGGMTEATARALAEFVRDGNLLMLWTGEAVSADNYNSTLLPAGLLPGPLVRRVSAPGDDVIRLDFNPADVHRYLGAFRGVQRSGLESAAVLQYWQVQSGDSPGETTGDTPGNGRNVETVMNFVGGDPAVLVHRLGAGRVLTATTAAADPEWTLLPVKDNFAAFVHELFSGAAGEAGGGAAWLNLRAGDVLEPPASAGVGADAVLRGPDGTTLPLESSVGDDGRLRPRSPPLDRVGAWQLESGDRAWPVAVNFPATESDVRPLESSAVRVALGGVDVDFRGDALPAAFGDDRDGVDYGWPLLLVVLMLCGIECLLATRMSNGSA